MSQLIRMYDDSGDGRITFDEFVEIVADLGFAIDRDSFIDAQDKGVEVVVEEKVEKEATSEDTGKFILLSSIADEDLRKALALFDEGDGSINLVKVQEAAEGKGQAKLHWSANRPQGGLSDHVKSVNHIAILVSDVSKSSQFYRNVIGLEQIRRPNFDSHGAWFTMGNCELHLIKGKPVVHEGDDLVVGHISLDAVNVGAVLAKLQKMNVPFRKNTSVPAGKDAGSMNTNSNNDMMSSKIVTQFFIQDPDGYYLEICNCDETLTQYCLGNKDDLANYEEGIKPLSLQAASTTFNLIQRWVTKLNSEKDGLAQLYSKVKDTNGTIKEVAALLNCTPAENVDPALLQIIIDRHSIYGDVCQNEEKEDFEEILLAAGNCAKNVESIIKLREKFRGKTIFRPPAVFNAGESQE
jgi:lactoylglutathione lyase